MNRPTTRIVFALLASSTACVGPREGVAVPPGSDLLVLEKSAARMSTRNPATGTLRGVLETGAGPHEVCVSDDGSRAVVANHGTAEPGATLAVYWLPEDRREHVVELGATRPHGLAFLDRRSTVAVTCEGEDKVLVVDVAAGKVLRRFDAGGKRPHMLAVPPDGGSIFVACMDSDEVVRLDAQSGAVLARARTGDQPEGLALAPDGRELWVANRGDDDLVVLDAQTLAERARLAVGDFPIRVEITPDGRMALVSNAASGDVSLVSVPQRRELRRIPLAEGSMPVGIEIEPQGRHAWVALTKLDQIAIVDLVGERVVGRIEGGAEPDGMAWVRRRQAFQFLPD
jgi:YVTN family beta-propeller protein